MCINIGAEKFHFLLKKLIQTRKFYLFYLLSLEIHTLYLYVSSGIDGLPESAAEHQMNQMMTVYSITP